ncbi:MAG: alkaline phosphatase D family protein [Proteobacteria bacterium]|nr:alkaline phosphatase D family protein [Pseudomonadota bacterium]
MLRRNFIRVLAGSAIFSWAGFRSRKAVATEISFAHGVASGDPLSDSVVIWTRISGLTDHSIAVRWSLASDPEMTQLVREGVANTNAERDYTVKVDADRLPAGQYLWYQFKVDGVTSPVGRTRTLPVGSVNAAKFAVVSCSNFPYGYFHAYREIANRDDLDAVIHLGDYIYEYGLGEYATERAETLGRVPEPPTELLTLDDYRRRHAQYKADEDSIAMHARHPLIAIWDDHEICNDGWRAGALNHQEDEGSWESRRDAAIQAYLEWMPIRAGHDREHTKIYRTFRFGDLLSLIMLDTRFYGRDQQPDVGKDVTPDSVADAMQDPERRVLGRRQEAWLRESLSNAADATWQIIGQQVLVSPLRSADLEPLLDREKESMLTPEYLDQITELSKDNPPVLLDTWDGYPVARQDFLEDISALAPNPVILSGDLHTSLAGNLIPSGFEKPVAVEFMTGSVSSPGFAEYLPEKKPGALRDATLELNQNLSYMETDRRGWMCLNVTHETCTAEWHLLDTVHAQEYSSVIDQCLAVRAGRMSDGIYEA